jgi:hypothetical protein
MCDAGIVGCIVRVRKIRQVFGNLLVATMDHSIYVIYAVYEVYVEAYRNCGNETDQSGEGVSEIWVCCWT